MLSSAEVEEAFYGSDGAFSRKVQNELKRVPLGQVAARLRQAHKLTLRGPFYYNERHCFNAHARRFYLVKELCETYLSDSGLSWGVVQLDPPVGYSYQRTKRWERTIPHRAYVCIDLPRVGQVGFTVPDSQGPAYLGKVEAVSRDQQTHRILKFCYNLCPSHPTLWEHLDI